MYDAEEWLAVSGLTVNISLIEQTLGRSNHSYWLRVGVMFDENETATAVETAAEEEEEEVGKHTADASLPSTAVDNKVDISPHILSSSSSKSNNQNDSNNQEDNCEKDTTSNAGGSTTDSGRLYTLAVLSSDVGKLIVPVLEDWVDLCSVRVLIVVGVVVVAVVVVPFKLHYAIYYVILYLYLWYTH